MQTSPVTDKDLGIAHSPWGLGDDRFRAVRQKAQEEREELRHRSKKDKQVKVPKFAPGDRVVIVVNPYQKRSYALIEVIDFNTERQWSCGFSYFAIILKTTDPKVLPRIGRLTSFDEDAHYRNCLANVEENDIKWLEERNTQ